MYISIIILLTGYTGNYRSSESERKETRLDDVFLTKIGDCLTYLPKRFFIS